MLDPGRILRPLGMLEKLYAARQALGCQTTVIVTATYELSSPCSDADISTLFRRLIVQLLSYHPALCIYVTDETSAKPAYACLKTIDLKDVLQIVTVENANARIRKLESLHNQAWPSGPSPLWKIIIMRAQESAASSPKPLLDVAFAYNHVIGDGLSGIALQASLLHELSRIDEMDPPVDETTHQLQVPVGHQLTSPIEKLISFPLSWSFLIKQIAQEYTPRWLIGDPTGLWAGLKVTTLEDCPYRSRIRLITISPSELKMLLKYSKEHNVTLTALLSASIAQTLAAKVPEASHLVGATPYSLRGATGTPADEIVLQVSLNKITYTASHLHALRSAQTRKERTEQLWKTATYVRRELQAEIARCPRNSVVGLLPYVNDHVNFYRKQIGRPRQSTWELSNLGVLRTPEHPSSKLWALKSLTFTQGALPFGAAFCVNCGSTQDGPLVISITWQEDVVAEELVEAVAQGLEGLARSDELA